MRLIEVSVTVLVVSLIFAITVFCYLSANRSFESIKNSSTGIRTAVKTDMKIRELIQSTEYSYLDSKKKALEWVIKKIKEEDFGKAKIKDVKTVLENTNDIFSSADITVSWTLNGKEYTSHALF